MNTPTPGVPEAPRVPPYAQPGPPGQAPTPPKRRARGWIIAVVVVVLLLFCGGCCLWPAAVALITTDAGAVYSNGVAIIHIDSIIAGTGGTDILGGTYVSPEYIIDLLRAADEDPAIEAVLLRIDSPGGTVAASQEIATEVARMRKPVVASIGDIGASGAYWIASQCDHVVANAGSTVGSIGVIIEIPNYEGLLEKIGVEYTVLTMGEYKDAGSPFRSLTATEMAMLEQDMREVYDMFILGVAEGRGLSEEEVREMATGWTWSGATALEMGLVDSVGTYRDAVDEAASLAGIEGEPAIIYYDEPSPLDFIYWLLTAMDRLGRIGEAALGAGAPVQPVPR